MGAGSHWQIWDLGLAGPSRPWYYAIIGVDPHVCPSMFLAHLGSFLGALAPGLEYAPLSMLGNYKEDRKPCERDISWL